MSDGTGSIGGIVFEYGTQIQVPDTTIVLTRNSDVFNYTTPVNSGAYHFNNLPVGTYQMDIKSPGFEPQSTPANVVAGSGTANIFLTPYAEKSTLGGRICTQGGGGIDGAVIGIISAESPHIRFAAISSDNGYYGFADIPVGSFTFTVQAIGYDPIDSGQGRITVNLGGGNVYNPSLQQSG